MWRKPNTRLLTKNLVPTIKHSKSVMVWACFTSKGTGKLVFIDGIMDSIMYVRILRENVKSFARKLGLDDFIFQQDNDPKHTSRLALEFFDTSDIELLEWPAQSPDINPIEHLWAYMKQELKKCPPKNVNDLKNKLVIIWNQIPITFCEKLVKSVPKRIEEVMRAKGGHTSY